MKKQNLIESIVLTVFGALIVLFEAFSTDISVAVIVLGSLLIVAGAIWIVITVTGKDFLNLGIFNSCKESEEAKERIITLLNDKANLTNANIELNNKIENLNKSIATLTEINNEAKAEIKKLKQAAKKAEPIENAETAEEVKPKKTKKVVTE